MQASLKGILLVSLGTTLFSSKSILIQLAYESGATVDQLMLIRMLVALPFYIVLGVLAWRSLKSKPQLIDCALIMLPGFACYHIASYLDMWSLQFLTAGLERVILFSYPIFVVIIRAFQGEYMNRVQVLGLALAYAGVLVFFYQDLQLHDVVSPVAVGAVLIAACLTAFYMLASQKYGRKFSSDFFTALAMGVTGFTIPMHYTFVFGFNADGISLTIFSYAVVLSLFATVLASVVLNRGIHIIGAQKGSVAGMLGPMITLCLAALILDQPFTLLHATATCMTILGVTVVTKPVVLSSALKSIKSFF